jgi:hypothetical protein
MAIKNWKKTGKGIWTNKGSYRQIVLVGQLPARKGWFVSTEGKLREKPFKTKSKALAYAKSYMRKH